MKAWLLRRVGLLPALPPAVPATATKLPPGLDAAGVQAFLDEVRRVLATEAKRSETFSQRATTILGFDGVIMSVLVAGFALIKPDVEFTLPFLVNAITVVVLPILSALACLSVLHPRKVEIPETAALRDQWDLFIQPASTVHPTAQLVNSFLGSDRDPLAAASREAASRCEAYKTALYLLIAAVIGLGVLVGQTLAQQT